VTPPPLVDVLAANDLDLGPDVGWTPTPFDDYDAPQSEAAIVRDGAGPNLL
jgi:hypothetical protein